MKRSYMTIIGAVAGLLFVALALALEPDSNLVSTTDLTTERYAWLEEDLDPPDTENISKRVSIEELEAINQYIFESNTSEDSGWGRYICMPEGSVYTDKVAPAFAAGSGVTAGEPVISGNKALIPLYPESEVVCCDVSFLTLAEAVDNGLAQVEDSDSVDKVYVINESDQPIFLMSGEIVFGGKQDRVIAQDMVIPAEKNRKFDIQVFCVERGRWTESDRGMTFTCRPDTWEEAVSREACAPEPESPAETVAQATTEDDKWKKLYQNLAGRGITCACILSDCGEGGQSEVWSRVSETNRRLGTDNPTSTYRNNLTSEEIHEQIREDMTVFLAATARDNKAIGYAFAVNGTVLYCDIFANPELCLKYRYGLLKAYLLETIGQENGRKAAPTTESFADFLKWVESCRLSDKARPGYAFFKSEYLKGCDCTYEGKRLHSGYYYDGFSDE
jgi:hypothetical protein